MSHKLLSAVSILPALLIMPAVADVINLNEQYNNGELKSIFYANGADFSLTTEMIEFVPSAGNFGILAGNGGNGYVGDDNTRSITLTTDGAAAASAQVGSTLNLKAKEMTFTSNFTSTDAFAAVLANWNGHVQIDGDVVNIKDTANGGAVMSLGSKDVASSVVINGKDVTLSSNSTKYGVLHVQNSTEEYDGDVSTLKITADNVTVTGNKYGLNAMSQGIAELVGNTTITAENALMTRGNAQVVINKSGEHTTKMDGDINFNYHEATSKTSIDALVDVTFAGADSYWTGNTVVGYDTMPADANKLQVSNATITLKDGATWNATKITDNKGDKDGVFYTALNNLNIDNGTVNIADATRGIAIDNADIKNGTFTGGHVQINKTATIADSKFANQSTDVNGGAIYNTGDMTLNNVVLRDNTSGDDGGAIFTTQGKLTVTNSVFENNTAEWDGALGVGTNGQDLVIKNTTFKDNSARSTGAVGVFTGPATLTDVVFNGNRATDSAEDGAGALFLGAVSQTTVDNGQFVANKSASWGGAIATRTGGKYDNSAAKLDITGGLFNGNSSATNGGAIYNAFYHSTANADAVTIADTKFVRNSAQNGGAIYNDGTGDKIGNGGVMQLSDVTFINNSATQGGAIYNTAGAEITLSGTNVFSGNRAGTSVNDIYNAGTVVISGGDTTMSGGILGDGDFTLSDGATLNLGTAIIQQKTAQIDGTVNAIILGGNSFGRLYGDVKFGDNAELNLNVAVAGTYKIFDADNDFAKINVGTLFDVQNNGSDGVVISARAADDIAEESGLSNVAAATLVGLANGGNSVASINAQRALSRGDTDYIEAESAKSAPADKPITHSVSTSVQNQVLSLVASRMAGVSTGRSGGDFVTTGASMWAHGLVNRSKMNNSFHGDTRGMAVGVDATFNRKYTFGMGYAYGDTDVHAGDNKTDIESNTLFAYAQYKPSNWFLNGVFNYTFADYSTGATLFGISMTSEYDVDSYGAQLMTGYDFATGVTPMAGVRYLHISQDDYNNGIANVKSDDSDFMTGVAGLKYAFDINVDREFILQPELRAAATYDFMSDESVATVLMPGAATYVVNADRLSRFGGEFGIGISALYSGVTVSLNYDLDLHKDYTSQTGMLKFRYNF